MTDRDIALGFAACWPDEQRVVMERNISSMSDKELRILVHMINHARLASEAARDAVVDGFLSGGEVV